VPRARRHPLTSAVRRALRRPLSPTSRRYLWLLDRRLATLAAGRAPGPAAADRKLARRFLARVAGHWDDGDENLVRGYLDSGGRRGARDAPGALLEAADGLGRIAARPATLWFFLWEMESMLEGLAQPEAGRRRG
jgi:hypothetical protein